MELKREVESVKMLVGVYIVNINIQNPFIKHLKSINDLKIIQLIKKFLENKK